MLITSIGSWGLPQAVVEAYAALGLQQLYPWQAAALECGASGNNLVYCAPTSGGKSLVADVLMLRRLCAWQQSAKRQRSRNTAAGRALVILPYISVVAEKTAHLSSLVQGMRWVVRGYLGSQEGTPLSKPDEVIAVCTPEKANMALNLLLQEQRLGELVAVVVDEAHMVADPQRGALLEILLSKLRVATVVPHGSCQLVAMSATMSGLDALSSWLDAALFMTNFRPVPLTEHVVMGGKVYRKVAPLGPGGTLEDVLVEEYKLPGPVGRDKDQVLPLVAQVVGAGHSVLVFCSSRSASEACAVMLAELLPAVLPVQPPPEVSAARQALVAGLQEELGGSLSNKLEQLLLSGVAYHHAGLTSQERAAVEAGYRGGALLVLAATSTLAAGVNLPARRVILRSIHQGGGPVSRAQYLQMIGRAGRAGQCAFGESFLMCPGASPATLQPELERLLQSSLPHVSSQLLGKDAPEQGLLSQAAGQALGAGGGLELEGVEEMSPGVQRLLLEGIAGGIAQDGLGIERLLRHTLLAQQMDWEQLSQVARLALAGLRARRLITLVKPTPQQPSHWKTSAVGAALYCSGMPPDSGVLLYERLKELQLGVVLGCSAHLLYVLLVEPLFEVFDWRIWQGMLQQLSPEHKRVAAAIGVSEEHCQRCLMGAKAQPGDSTKHARFAGAVLLDRLLGGASAAQLEREWGAPLGLSRGGFSRGQLQHWQQEVSKWAGMAGVMADKAGAWHLETLLASLAAQMAAGVRPEMLPLMQVPGMRGGEARKLYAAGYRRPELVAAAAEQDLAAALAAGGKRQAAGSLVNTAAIAAKRAASRVLAACRQHLIAETLAGEEPDASGRCGGSGGSGGATAAGVEGADSIGQGCQQQQQVQGVVSPQLSGHVGVHQVSLDQPDRVTELIALWQMQPAFAWALVWPPSSSRRPSGGGPGPSGAEEGGKGEVGVGSLLLSGDSPVQLALCFSEREVLLVQLPPPGSGRSTAQAAPQQQHKRQQHGQQQMEQQQKGQQHGLQQEREQHGLQQEREQHGLQQEREEQEEQQQQQVERPAADTTAQQLLTCMARIFSDPNRVAICWDSTAAAAALSRICGCSIRCQPEDPLAAFCCWAPEAAARAGDPPPVGTALLKLVSNRVTPGYHMRVPLLGSAGETWAVQQAAFSWVAMPVLRRLLAVWQCSRAYRPLLMSTQAAMGAAASSGLVVSATSLAAAAAEAAWGLHQLQHLLSQQLQGAIQRPEDLLSLLEVAAAPGLNPGKRQQRPTSVSDVESAVVASIRAAFKYGQQPWLQLLRAALTYCRLYTAHSTTQQLLSAAQQHHLGLQLQLGSSYSSLPGGLLLAGPPQLQQLLLLGVALPACPLQVCGSLAQRPHVPLPSVVRVVVPSGPEPGDPGVYGCCGEALWPQANQLPHAGWQGDDARTVAVGRVRYWEPGTGCLRQAWLPAQEVWELLVVVAGGGAAQAGAAGDVAAEGAYTGQQQLGGPGGGPPYQQQHHHHHQQQQHPQQPQHHHQQQQQHHHQQQQQHSQQQQQQHLQWQPQHAQAPHHPAAPQVVTAAVTWHLRAALVPSCPGHTFLGCELTHLDLLVLAGLGRDPPLVAACCSQDPLAAAVAAWQPHWPPCAARALAAVASGCVDGVPVSAAAAAGGLWQQVVRALVAGISPGALGKVVGLDAAAAGALMESLLVAFHGVKAALDASLAACTKHSYVTSPCGRRLLCQLPPPSLSFSTKEAKQRHEGQRLATSLTLAAARGDLLLALVAGLQQGWGLTPPIPTTSGSSSNGGLYTAEKWWG